MTRENWPLFAAALLLVFTIVLFWVMPADFYGPLSAVVMLLLLIPGFWGVVALVLWLVALPGKWRALDPNLSPEALKALAAHHPEVLQNKALPLLALEDPNFFIELEALALATRAAQREGWREFRQVVNESLRLLLLFPSLMLLVLLWVWLARPFAEERSDPETAAPQQVFMSGFFVFGSGSTGRIASRSPRSARRLFRR